MREKLRWVGCFLALTASWAHAQTSQIFLKRGGQMSLIVQRVQQRCLFAKEEGAVYLRLVDSVRTSDLNLVSAILAQRIENLKVRLRDAMYTVDLSQANFPSIKIEESRAMIYKSIALYYSFAEIPRYSFQLDHSWSKLPTMFFRLSVGVGLPFSGPASPSSQCGYGLGIDKTHKAVRATVGLHYAHVFDHRHLLRARRDYPNYHSLSAGGDLRYQVQAIKMEFVIGLDYRFFESNAIAKPDVRIGWRLGIGKKLN